MSDAQSNVCVSLDGQVKEVPLSAIAGLDMSGIEPYRGGEATPEGVYEWRIKNFEMAMKEIMDKTVNAKVARPCVFITLEAIAAQTVKDPSVDPSSLTGLEHREMISIKDVRKDLGRVVAFMQDIGFNGTGQLNALMPQTIGMEFIGEIKHSKNPNDTSKVYANLNFNNLKPIGEWRTTSVAPKAPQPSAPAQPVIPPAAAVPNTPMPFSL